MAKITKETEKTFEENLKYIGLNLNKIPSFLKKYEGLNFRPSKSYDDVNFNLFTVVDIYIISLIIFIIHIFLFYIGFSISYECKILGETKNVRWFATRTERYKEKQATIFSLYFK